MGWGLKIHSYMTICLFIIAISLSIVAALQCAAKTMPSICPPAPQICPYRAWLGFLGICTYLMPEASLYGCFWRVFGNENKAWTNWTKEKAMWVCSHCPIDFSDVAKPAENHSLGIFLLDSDIFQEYFPFGFRSLFSESAMMLEVISGITIIQHFRCSFPRC